MDETRSPRIRQLTYELPTKWVRADWPGLATPACARGLLCAADCSRAGPRALTLAGRPSAVSREEVMAGREKREKEKEMRRKERGRREEKRKREAGEGKREKRGG